MARSADEPEPLDDGDLAAWTGRLVSDTAARERAQTYWLGRQADEEGTFCGVLADLAERGRPVLLHLSNGRKHRGLVTVLGRDFVALRLDQGRSVLIRLDAIASVRSGPTEPRTAGDHVTRGDVSMAATIAALAEERTEVLLVSAFANEAVRGELRAVGRDVATVRLAGEGGTAYVALASVSEVSLPESG